MSAVRIPQRKPTKKKKRKHVVIELSSDEECPRKKIKTEPKAKTPCIRVPTVESALRDACLLEDQDARIRAVLHIVCATCRHFNGDFNAVCDDSAMDRAIWVSTDPLSFKPVELKKYLRHMEFNDRTAWSFELAVESLEQRNAPEDVIRLARELHAKAPLYDDE